MTISNFTKKDNDKDEIGSDENSSDNGDKYIFKVKDNKSSGESRLIEDKNPNPQGPLKEISKIIQKHKKEKYGNEHKNRKHDSLENIKYSNTNENMIVSNGDTLEDVGSKSMMRTDSFIEDEVRKVRVSNEIQRSIPQSIEEDDAKNVKGNGAIPIKAFKRSLIFIILLMFPSQIPFTPLLNQRM